MFENLKYYLFIFNYILKMIFMFNVLFLIIIYVYIIIF